MLQNKGLSLAIDIGGTFTDTVLMDQSGKILSTCKTPTTPDNPTNAALDGTRHTLDDVRAELCGVESFVHGTTLATNALIERRGARVATITNDGFRDILEIANERRYSQYDINIEKPDLLVPRSRAFTIRGRMNAHGDEIESLDLAAVAGLAEALKQSKAETLAICLLHSYINPAHEERLRDLLLDKLPNLAISISSEISPEAREFDRLCTTIANAYIQPLMQQYLSEFAARFSDHGLTCPILMMTAGGGMTTLETAAKLPIRLVESGPAGGALLAARIAQTAALPQVLSFDMGGTTAKLCLIDNYQPQSARKFEIARAERFIKGSGMPVRIPVLEMIEIGAGGGSIADLDRIGRLNVGPRSAGSVPGPAAFCKGGTEATVTDADIVQGLIIPENFADGRLKIDPEAATDAIASNIGEISGLEPGAAATGISDIVDESMAAAGRMHAVESGKDLGQRTMIAFGGNGPLHATRVARRAGVTRILIPRDPGVGSAVGFLYAPVSYEISRSYYTTLENLDIAELNHLFDVMINEATTVVRSGAPRGDLACTRNAFMRYHGQGHEIEIPLPDRPLETQDAETLRATFEAEYIKQFTRAVPSMVIEILNWSVRISTHAPVPSAAHAPATRVRARALRQHEILCDVSNRRRPVNVYDRASLIPGNCLDGPALIVEPQTTSYVSADFSAEVDGDGNLILNRQEVAS